MAAKMKLRDVDALIARLRREFPDVEAYVILRMAASAADAVPSEEAVSARQVEALCRAGLHLDWHPNEFLQVVDSLDTARNESPRALRSLGSTG